MLLACTVPCAGTGIESLREWLTRQGSVAAHPQASPALTLSPFWTPLPAQLPVITSELQRCLDQEAPKGKGQTWASVIAEALLVKARKGDVRAFSELANRMEDRRAQDVAFRESFGLELVDTRIG
jgi:hypothetical protein